MKRNHLFLLFTPVITDSCGLLETDLIEHKQNILFEVEYINTEWGYTHSGLYINRLGEIYTYKSNADSDPWIQNSDDYYSEQELQDKFTGRKLIDSVEPHILEKKINLIEQVKKFEYNDHFEIGNGFDQLHYICYSFDYRKGKYLRLTLAKEGSMNVQRKSSASYALVNWLKSININPGISLNSRKSG